MFYDLSELPSDETIVNRFVEESTASYDGAEPWPVDAVRLLVYRDPDRAWNVICRLIDVAPKELLGHIGSGPLEEFVNRYGDRYVSEIEAASAGEKFLMALSNVWVSRGVFPEEIERRLTRASGGAIMLLDLDDNASPNR